jgi:hypothetical protein
MHAAPLSFIQVHILLFSSRVVSFPSFTSYHSSPFFLFSPFHFSLPFLTSPHLTSSPSTSPVLPRHISPLFSSTSSCCFAALYDGRSDSPARHGSRTLPTQQTLVLCCIGLIVLFLNALDRVGSEWTFFLDFLCSCSFTSFETSICHTMYA